MIEVTLWILLATSNISGGYVAKIDEFLTLESCSNAATKTLRWHLNGPLRCVEMTVARPASYLAK